MVTTKPDIESVSSLGNLLLIKGTITPALGGGVTIATEDGWDFSDFVSSIVSFNIDSFTGIGDVFNREGVKTGTGFVTNYISDGYNVLSKSFRSGMTDTNGRMASGDTALEIIDAGSGYSAGSGVTLTGVLSGQTCNATITVSGGALATVKATTNGTGITENEPMTVAGGTGGFVRANLSDATTPTGFADVKNMSNRPSILIKNDNIIRIVGYMDSKIWGAATAFAKYRFTLIGRR